MTRSFGCALLVWTVSLISALVIPALGSAQSMGAGTVSIRQFVDDVPTILAQDEGGGADVAVSASSGIGNDGVASALAFASVQSVSFPPPGTLPGTSIAYGGVDIGAFISVAGNAQLPLTPNIGILAEAEVFWGQEWLLTGTPTGPGPNLVDVVVDVSGILDRGGAGQFTSVIASIGFGLVYDEPGVGPSYGSLFENFQCQVESGIADCFYDGIDDTGLTVVTGFEDVSVSGQFVISVSGLLLDTPFQAGPRLTLSVQDDLTSEITSFDPAIADFSGSVRFALVPQDPGISITAVPEPAVGSLGIASLLTLESLRRIRRRRLDFADLAR